MQPLEIISINIWNVLISLCNLAVLYFILKRFLYKPVKKVLNARREQLENSYIEAEGAKAEADMNKQLWEEKLATANEQADEIIDKATKSAQRRSMDIVEAGEAEADRIRAQAASDAELERKKAQSEIKREIVDISVALSEKILEREVNADDHRDLIDKFISEIGEEDAADR